MKDLMYGFKLGLGFLLAQLVFWVIGFAIGFGLLYGIGSTLVHIATQALSN